MVVPSPFPDNHDRRATKQRLREGALVARREHARSLAPEMRATLEADLAERLVPHIGTGAVLGAYHPLRDEISPLPALQRLPSGQAVALPWFSDREARMTWRRGPAVERGPWGMLQPAADAEMMAPDLLLVPLVLADRQGARIGHGQGHYDRAIAQLREGGGMARTIGLAWDIQIVEEPLPVEPFDQPLDAIATPSEYLSWNR